jgi:hypothetical protein
MNGGGGPAEIGKTKPVNHKGHEGTQRKAEQRARLFHTSIAKVYAYAAYLLLGVITGSAHVL